MSSINSNINTNKLCSNFLSSNFTGSNKQNRNEKIFFQKINEIENVKQQQNDDKKIWEENNVNLFHTSSEKNLLNSHSINNNIFNDTISCQGMKTDYLGCINLIENYNSNFKKYESVIQNFLKDA